MNPDGWSAIAGWASAGIAGIGTIVAVWQARVARRSARAADRALTYAWSQARSASDSATSARESARAAVIQARAATEQLELMREQRDAETARDHRAASPVFDLVAFPDSRLGTLDLSDPDRPRISPARRGRAGTQYRGHTVRIGLTSGDGEFIVTVRPAGAAAAHVVTDDGRPLRMVSGSSTLVTVITDDAPTRTALELLVTSVRADDPAARWERTVSVPLP